MILSTVLMLSALLQPAAPSLADVKPLFAALAGAWSCSGAFANGRPLAADIKFTPELDGRVLRYEHRDRAPGDFVHDARWGADEKNGQIVSLAFAGSSKTIAPALFVAKGWSAYSIVLEAQPLTSPPYAPNRFTYTVDASSLKMVWEVQRGGVWAEGDHLACTRK